MMTTLPLMPSLHPRSMVTAQVFREASAIHALDDTAAPPAKKRSLGHGSRRPFRDISNAQAQAKLQAQLKPQPQPQPQKQKQPQPTAQLKPQPQLQGPPPVQKDATPPGSPVDVASHVVIAILDADDDDHAQVDDASDVEMEPTEHERRAEATLRFLQASEYNPALNLDALIYEKLLLKQSSNTNALIDYFDRQPRLNARMRSILVDWLIEVHHRFKLGTETLFLTVNFLDRYLATTAIARNELQLVGVSALFVAAKFDEVDPIRVSDLVYVCDDMYTAAEIIETERKLLAALRFDLGAATPHAFLQCMQTRLPMASPLVAPLTAYLTQQTLLHLPVAVAHPPAVLAASSLYLAHCAALGARPDTEWLERWETSTGFTRRALTPCLRDLCALAAMPPSKLSSLRRKFTSKRFGRVGALTSPPCALDRLHVFV